MGIDPLNPVIHWGERVNKEQVEPVRLIDKGRKLTMTGSAKDDMTQEGKTFEMQQGRRDGKCQPRVFLCYVNAYSVCEIQL